jgi:hypothetical protein
VKAYRQRAYTKLGVTSERQIFQAYIRFLAERLLKAKSLSNSCLSMASSMICLLP